MLFTVIVTVNLPICNVIVIGICLTPFRVVWLTASPLAASGVAPVGDFKIAHTPGVCQALFAKKISGCPVTPRRGVKKFFGLLSRPK